MQYWLSYKLILFLSHSGTPCSYAKILGEKHFHTRKIPRSGSKAKDGEKKEENTAGTAGGPGGRDRTLVVKSWKIAWKSPFFRKKNKNYLNFFFLNISSSYAKIFGETNFRAREIPQSGSKAKDGEKKEKRRRRRGERERLNDGDNNGQATHGARKHAWRTQAAWAKRKKEERAKVVNKTMANYALQRHLVWRTQSRLGQFYVP